MRFLVNRTSSISGEGSLCRGGDGPGGGISLHLHVNRQHVLVVQNRINRDSRETLNHFNVMSRMADTAFDVISRCRVTSISSNVGGWAGGCSGTVLIAGENRY